MIDDRPLDDTLADMTSLARRVRAEAEVMGVRTRQQGRLYVVLALFVATYLAWSFLRVARFLETEHLATLTGDIAVGRAVDLVDDANGEARAAAPKLVRRAELTFINAIPEVGKQLDLTLRRHVGVAFQTAIAVHDEALIEELLKLPDGRKRVAAAAADPAEAAKLFAEVHERVRARPEVRAASLLPSPELIDLRDHVRHLADPGGLSTTEWTERRFLQGAIAKSLGAEGTVPAVEAAKQ